MAAGMDGCVSKPADPRPLLNTLRAAIPLHLSPASLEDGRPLAIPSKFPPGTTGGGSMKPERGKGLVLSKGSAEYAAEGMVVAGRRSDKSVEGALQVK